MKAAIAELEQRLAAHDAQRDRIVAALNAVRALDGDAPVTSGRGETTVLTVVRAPKTKADPKATPAKRGGGRAVAEHVIANARAIAERDGLPAAVKSTGVPYATLYTYAKKQRWVMPAKKGQRPAKGAPGPAKKPAVGTRCPKCRLVTTENPCSCGTRKAA